MHNGIPILVTAILGTAHPIVELWCWARPTSECWVALLSSIAELSIVAGGLARSMRDQVQILVAAVYGAWDAIIDLRSDACDTILFHITTLGAVAEKPIVTGGLDGLVNHDVGHFVAAIRCTVHPIIQHGSGSSHAP